MDIFYSPRLGGKTHRIVAWAKQNDAAILVASAAERKYITERHRFPSDRIFTMDQLKNGKLKGVTRKLAVDNVDWVLEAFIGRPVNAITATGEAEPAIVL